jgi:hypothetical protein
VLSCLLLSSLIFSATFGVLHRHDPNVTRRATIESADVGAVVPTDGSGSQTNDPLQSKDCSICQLQRHLSSGLFYGPVFISAPPSEHAFELIISASYLSAPDNPQRGRAPPQTSL